MRKQAVLTAPPAWVNSRHGLTEGKAIRFTKESEVSEWKETAALWPYNVAILLSPLL